MQVKYAKSFILDDSFINTSDEGIYDTIIEKAYLNKQQTDSTAFSIIPPVILEKSFKIKQQANSTDLFTSLSALSDNNPEDLAIFFKKLKEMRLLNTEQLNDLIISFYDTKLKIDLQELKNDLKQMLLDYSNLDLPKIDLNIFNFTTSFYKKTFEKILEKQIILPPLNVSYYEGYNGSIELSLVRTKYRLLINISSKNLLYSILHRKNNKIVRKGSVDIIKLYDKTFIDKFASDIVYFEEI